MSTSLFTIASSKHKGVAKMEKNALALDKPINEEIRDALDRLSQAYKRGFDDGIKSVEKRNEMIDEIVQEFWDTI